MSWGNIVWCHAQDLALVETVDRVVVLHLGHLDRATRILEGSAAAIWKAVDGLRSQSQVIQVVAEQYDVAVEAIARDVAELLRELEQDDLLQVSDRP